MFVKIDLYSGESSIVEYSEELREELNSCEYSKGVIDVYRGEEEMYIEIVKEK